MQMTEAKRLGAALRRLRLRFELTQAHAAELANTRQQTWQRYESGGNDALLKVTLQRRLAEAIGADHEMFLMELAGIDSRKPGYRQGPSLGEIGVVGRVTLPVGGQVRVGPRDLNFYDEREPEVLDLTPFFAEDARVLRLAGESMIPYAEPGGFVTYNLRRYPRRGQGCVVELTNGDFYVKRYERREDDGLVVTELHPAEREIRFALGDVKGIYAVGLRGD